MNETVRLLDLDAASYVAHSLHAGERAWTETNCYVDLWIEVLHALGQDPLAAGAFVLSADFACDQWTFIKFPPEDLRRLYGIEVAEMAVWRGVLDHAVAHLQAGRLLTIEVDSWWLPDTRGTAYRAQHVKSTIVPESVDVAGKRMGYFHNAGYFTLAGDDFDGVFSPLPLPPYVEDIDLARMRRGDDGLTEVAIALTREHLARRPPDNPVARMGARIVADLDWLAEGGLDAFHEYAFVTVRQFGATCELAASFATWLANRDIPVGDAAAAFQLASETAKALQFGLARRARGRLYDPTPPMAVMADAWSRGVQSVVDGVG